MRNQLKRAFITVAAVASLVAAVSLSAQESRTARGQLLRVDENAKTVAIRSAEAGQRIKQLIGRSRTEITNGARVVRETSEVLESISAKVVTASEQMDVIARSSREQYNALHEVNSSVNRMDQMTQQNAAMVEETTAASQTLAEQSLQLQKLLSAFHLGSRADTARARAA